MTESYIKKDNIKDTPLGHEIVHQWFGNSVFADFEKGNWHEGLTIYFADHLDEEINNQSLMP
jgi:aminopeptidase N